MILAELITRIQLRKDGEPALHGFHPVAVLLSYLTKVRPPWGAPVLWAATGERALGLRECWGKGLALLFSLNVALNVAHG